MNTKDIKPVDLGDVKKARNRIYRVGIELEGKWPNHPKGCQVVRDGSVEFPNMEGKVGEIQSPPLPVEEIEAWVKKAYPAEVNHTCGLHVHVSFKSALTYQRLMDPRFQSTVINYFGKWAKKVKLDPKHPLWARLEGKSIYCQHQFHADEQVLNIDRDFNKERRGHRYTVINYCWGRTSTLECRLLPAMDTVELALDAIDTFINITNGFLVATAKREDKLVGEGLIKGKGISEVRDVRFRR